MKISPFKIFLIGSIMLLSAGIGEVYAQESGSPSFELYDADESANEVIILAPGSTDARSHTPSDSLSAARNPLHPAKSSTSSKSSNKQKDDDDSILSFNFLYYLIERYKLQDIVD